MSNTGDVPLAGTDANSGHRGVERRNRQPHIRVDKPVRAPDFIPGVDSGEIIIGPPPSSVYSVYSV